MTAVRLLGFGGTTRIRAADGDLGAVPAARLSGTFIQLLASHAKWTEEQWDELFRCFGSLHLRQIVLQWTVLDDLTFFPDLAADILTKADEGNMRVLVGLVQRTDYWNRIAGNATESKTYLDRLRQDHLDLAERLKPLVFDHRSFAGWYLPEEIDDINWREPGKQAVLLEHLSLLTSQLRHISPQADLAVSTFSQAQSDPVAFGNLWRQILNCSHLTRVLFQDGVGVHKLSSEQVPLYLSQLRSSAASVTVDTVVELFEQTSGPPLDDKPFGAIPAPWERVEKQLAAATFRPDAGMLIGFSVPDYMSPQAGKAAQILYEDYLRSSPNSAGSK